MINVIKPSINFLNRDSNSRLVVDSGNIITSMTGNTNFPTPDPTLTVVTTARDAFVVAVHEAMHRDSEKVAVRNAKRAELVSLLRQLSNYVDSKSNEDMAVLLSSGFPAQKTPRQPVGPVATPYAPVLRQGPVTGLLKARTGKIAGANASNWRIALASAPLVYVQTAQTTGARHDFPGLTPGETYIVEVNALGAAGASDWSPSTSLMVI